MSDNPLQKLYRSKKVFVSLPSRGKYYDSGIKLSADNEIGIMAMTATDEIKLKTPDALFNGEALFELFKSCVPDIADPREIPVCDIDKLLLAIRMATSGPTIDINSKCPKCKHTEKYEVDLTTIMNSAKDIASDNTITVDGVVIQVRPLTLRNQILAQMDSFYQYRMQQLLNDDSIPDSERAEQFNLILVQAIVLQTSQIADCISHVTLDDDTVVTEKEHIFGWVENMESTTHAKIKKTIETLCDPKMSDKVKIKCAHDECTHEYSTKIDLNPTNFF